jgi:hypothetical protein
VIAQARARQHRRRQRILRTSAPFVGAGAGLVARKGRGWLHHTGHKPPRDKKTHYYRHHRWPAIAAGAGSFTTQGLFGQINRDYNRSIASTPPPLRAFAAASPTGQSGGVIVEKRGCAPISRPNGPGDGIPDLAVSIAGGSGQYCTNFATSPRGRAPGDPPNEPGGVTFVTLAGDAITWSTQTVTDAPASLTPGQLRAIYTCTDTNWSQVGGKDAPIQPFLPQPDSGTRALWLSMIGVYSIGPCVDTLGNTLEENEGVNPALDSPEVILPYSIGDYIDQKYHSAPCLTPACTASGNGSPCPRVPGMNRYGCDLHGTMALGEIGGAAPTAGSGLATRINPAFPAAFEEPLYEVVPYDPNTLDHIPGSEPGAPGGVNLETIFGASGWVCTSPGARKDIRSYGFITLPNCGRTS